MFKWKQIMTRKKYIFWVKAGRTCLCKDAMKHVNVCLHTSSLKLMKLTTSESLYKNNSADVNECKTVSSRFKVEVTKRDNCNAPYLSIMTPPCRTKSLSWVAAAENVALNGEPKQQSLSNRSLFKQLLYLQTTERQIICHLLDTEKKKSTQVKCLE